MAVEVVTSSGEGEWYSDASSKWHGNCSKPPLPDLDGLGVPATFKFYKDPARAVDVARNVYGKWSKAWEMVLREEAKKRYRVRVGRAVPLRRGLVRASSTTERNWRRLRAHPDLERRERPVRVL